MRRRDEEGAAEERDATPVGPLTRREFLRMAGTIAGAVAGVGAGFGGVLAGCDGDQQTSNTTATIHPGQVTTTAATAPTSTTVTVGPESGRDIKIGLVSAMSGPLALFGKADDWWTTFASEAVPDGVLCGDGKLHRFAFLRRDSGSDPERAAKAAAGLIVDDRVDVIMCSGGADIVVPVADQAEALVCPCLCSFVPWRSFVFGRAGAVDRFFRWSYAHAVGLEDIAANFTAMWDRLETNKTVGLIFADSIEGRMWADAATGLPAAAAAAGYEYILPGLYPVSGGDYASYISEFKKNGCEICCGALTTDAFVDFWRQSLEQEYRPKIVTIGEGLIFPQALEAVGATARNITAESLWQPDWPYTDSITGKTCRELAKDYMARTGDQWIAPIAQYAKFEWVVDVFRRVTNINSRREIIARVGSTDIDTCLGPIDFTARVDTADLNRSKRPAENVYKAPVGGAQWVEGDAFAYEPRLVTAVSSLGLPVSGDVEPMEYGS